MPQGWPWGFHKSGPEDATDDGLTWAHAGISVAPGLWRDLDVMWCWDKEMEGLGLFHMNSWFLIEFSR